MDLACPFCHAALPPGAPGCAACGGVVVQESQVPRPTSHEHSRALRTRLTEPDGPARDRALHALGHLVRPGRGRAPWTAASRRAQATALPPPAGAPRRRLAAVLARTPAWGVSAVLHVVVLAIFALISFGVVQVAAPLVVLRTAAVPPPAERLPDLPEAGNADLLKDLDRLPPMPEIPADLLDKLAETPDGAAAPGVRPAERLPIGVADSKYGWRGDAGRRYAAATAGGTWGSEKAVDAGLRWLADHQQPEGWWGFHEGIEECTKATTGQRVGLTGLALLAFLGAGNAPAAGKYHATVKRGIDWLVSQQSDRGAFAAADPHCSRQEMYHQAIATLALCEAVGMGARELMSPARSALSYLTWAQNADGGWRYVPRSGASDVSVTGWGVMALSAARAAGVRQIDEPMARARSFLDVCTAPNGEVGYQGPDGGVPGLTAVGVLGKYLAGAAHDERLQRLGAQATVEPLPQWDVPELAEGGGRKPRAQVFRRDNPVDFYRWYYTSLALIHRNDESWRRWNPACRDLLVRRQRGGDPCIAGSWDPVGVWCGAAGRAYATSMAVLTLEVYYRAAPAFLSVPEDPLEDIPVGSALHGQELVERAMDAVARARESQRTDSARAHAAVAAAQDALERFRAWALSHLARALPDGRADVEAWLRLADRQAGELALVAGDRDRALTLLVPALLRDPDGADAPRVRRLVIQSLIESAQDRRRAADEAGAVAAEAKAARLLGDLLDRREEPEPAAARRLRALAGDLHARAGDLAAAAAAYRAALDGASADVVDDLRRRLASVLLRQHDWSGALEAIGALGAGGALDPVVACNAAAALAERIRAEGDPVTAARIYRDTLDRFGGVEAATVPIAGLWRGLAESLGEASRWPEAAEAWLQLVDRGYGNAARLRAADAMVRGGRANEALPIAADLQGTLAPFSPEWWEARCIYAEGLFAAGRHEQCVELVKNTQLLYPTLGGDALKARFLAVLMKASAKRPRRD